MRSSLFFSFSATGADILPDNIKRFNEEVIIKVPFPEQGLPDYFFIKILTKDKFGVAIDHTAWQQVQIK